MKALELPSESQTVLMELRIGRRPSLAADQTLFYRLNEVVLLYGAVFKDVAHERFGDAVMSAIDMPAEVLRMELTLNGKWLQFKKF